MPCSICNEKGHNRVTCLFTKKKNEIINTIRMPSIFDKKKNEDTIKPKGLVISRMSTLNYEIKKTLNAKVPQLTYKQCNFTDNINNMFSTTQCVYCANKGKLNSDHFHSVISKDINLRNTYNNLSELKVPCCTDCNSSKGNKHWKEFIQTKKHLDGFNQRIEILEKLDFAILQQKIEYTIHPDDKDKLDKAYEVLKKSISDFQEILNSTRMIPKM
jgi:5-methylcytosine-specific restriction endonuclease McrA